MVFNVTIPNLINTIFISAGIGVCVLNLLQLRKASQTMPEVKAYFTVFFSLLLTYITTHLARQLMDGLPGDGIAIALYAVTFLEMLSAGLMANMLAVLVLTVAYDNKPPKPLFVLVMGLLAFHAIVLLADLFGHFVYFFDAANVYHRGPLYILSNLGPIGMMLVTMVVLFRHGDRFSGRVRSALWAYMIAPIVAIAIQAFTYGIQFIMIATVAAAVYMFLVIVSEQNEEYQKQREESSRLDTELNLASRIQADMLPNIFPAFPERDEFDIYASMLPAKEVGGDFYDFFFVDKDHLAIVMADVSGKGVPAALFMMISKILVQNFAITGRSPKETLEATNNQICANNREDMFVTVWLGILDVKTGIIVASNAGHEYPALKPADGSFDLVKDRHGLVIGGMEGMRYSEYEIQLDPGAMLYLYTDGVPEATNADEELFGTERMVEALREAENGSPADVLESINASVAAFVGDAPQFDDLTMLCLKYLGPQS